MKDPDFRTGLLTSIKELSLSLERLNHECREINAAGRCRSGELEEIGTQHALLVSSILELLQAYVDGDPFLQSLLERRLFEISLELLLQKNKIIYIP